MTREEIEQIIRENIRTNGRGEITARVMAGVLESFVSYTDSQAETFAALCEALAASFNALVQEMEGKFEDKAAALEAAMEAFCSDLLNNHFIPWAEGLAGSLSDKMDLTKAAAEAARAAALEAKAASLEARAAAIQAEAKADDAKTAAMDAKAGSILAAEKSSDAKAAIDSAADGIAEALLIIREGNTKAPVNYEGMPVLFFDYDGRIVIGYTVEDFLALEAMPENPEHDGLTAQGWNWTLANAQAYVQKYGRLNIGQKYTTTDGKLHLKITLSSSLVFSFIAIAGDVDWGDGSPVQTVTDGGSHTYAAAGEYEVIISGVTRIGTSAFSGCSALQAVTIPEGVTGIGTNAFSGCYALRAVTIPESVTGIGTSTFQNCYALQEVTIPEGVTVIGTSAFNGCFALHAVAIPDGVTSIEPSAFNSCSALQAVTIPEGVTNILSSALNYCRSLQEVTIPEGVTRIESNAFNNCFALRVVCNAVTPPTLASSVFVLQNPVRIFVPDARVNVYKAATNWRSYANIIFPISEKF